MAAQPLAHFPDHFPHAILFIQPAGQISVGEDADEEEDDGEEEEEEDDNFATGERERGAGSQNLIRIAFVTGVRSWFCELTHARTGTRIHFQREGGERG